VRTGGKDLFDTAQQRVSLEFPAVRGTDLTGTGARVDEVMVHFITPTRIQVNGKFQNLIRFDVLVRQLLRRMTVLASHYCGGPPRWEVGEWLDRASRVGVRGHHLHWESLSRYSYRQERSVAMGGIVGSITYGGELGPFMPLLRLGERLHVGKGTAFGLGRMRLEAGSSPHT